MRSLRLGWEKQMYSKTITRIHCAHYTYLVLFIRFDTYCQPPPNTNTHNLSLTETDPTATRVLSTPSTTVTSISNPCHRDDADSLCFKHGQGSLLAPQAWKVDDAGILSKEGKKVPHMHRNDYYGGASASLTPLDKVRGGPPVHHHCDRHTSYKCTRFISLCRKRVVPDSPQGCNDTPAHTHTHTHTCFFSPIYKPPSTVIW